MSKTSNPQFDQLNAAAAKQMAEMGETIQQTLNAFAQSGQIWAQNAATINQSAMQAMQEMGQQNSTAMRDMMGAKSLDDMAAQQATLAQQTMQGWVSLMNMMGEASMKAMMEAGESLSQQMAKGMAQATSKATKAA